MKSQTTAADRKTEAARRTADHERTARAAANQANQACVHHDKPRAEAEANRASDAAEAASLAAEQTRQPHPEPKTLKEADAAGLAWDATDAETHAAHWHHEALDAANRGDAEEANQHAQAATKAAKRPTPQQTEPEVAGTTVTFLAASAHAHAAEAQSTKVRTTAREEEPALTAERLGTLTAGELADKLALVPRDTPVVALSSVSVFANPLSWLGLGTKGKEEGLAFLVVNDDEGVWGGEEVEAENLCEV